MDEFAKFLQLCDIKLQKKYQTKLNQIMQIDIDNKVETVMMLLLSDDELKYFVSQYNMHDLLYEYLEGYSEKKIFTISDKTLELSTSRPYDLSDDEYLISEKRLDNIFKALEKNMELFEKVYKDKIWIIDSSIGRSEKISISPTRFFHLMGFDEKDFKDSDSMKAFESVFNSGDNIKSLMTDRKDLFAVLEKLLERETIVKEAILDGTLKPVINPYKLEMKNFGFERMGTLKSSSGMIFYDKEKARSFGFNTRLQTDLILLSNFIRKYNLEFIFSCYKQYKHNKKGKDGESLIIPQKGYENSEFLIGQTATISERAKRYSKHDFDFSISLQDDPSSDSFPNAEPEEIVEYSLEDKARMASSIIKGLPILDMSHLSKVHEELMRAIERQNTRDKEITISKEIITEISKLDIESLENLYNDVIELSSVNEKSFYYSDDLKNVYQQEIFYNLKYLKPEQIAEIRSRISDTQYTKMHKKNK